MERFFDLISQINSPEIQQALWPFRLLFGAVGILFLAFSIYVLSRTAWLNFAVIFDLSEFFTFRPYGLRRMSKRWLKVQDRLSTANEAEYKLAVIEADAMLNEVLQRMGFRGETLGDRLRSLTPAIIPNLNDVWTAHQARNNVVHDPDYRLTLDEAKKALAVYETSFRNLDLL